ncbi:MAG: prohibitin family protein [Saprospiraceae bacterium]|nr:prohibitin family protein [Saprospiraceae bacterium]
MFLAILGIFIAIIASTVSKANPNLSGMGRTGRFIGIALVALGLLTACFVQISPGIVGVQTLFGKVQPGILTEGLNVVNPLIEVVEFDVRTQNYTMSGVTDEGEKMGDDAIRVLSADGLEVVIDMTVLFRVLPNKAPEILRTIGREYRDVIIRPLVRTKSRDFAAYYDAVSLYSSKRDEFQQRLFSAMEKEFNTRGIRLEQVLIRNINLPESVKNAIETKINAEQEAQKMKFVLDKERQEAERKRVEAQGIADYQRILTSTLTDKLLQYEQIQVQKELVKSPNAKVIVMGNGKTAPILIGQ